MAECSDWYLTFTSSLFLAQINAIKARFYSLSWTLCSETGNYILF